MVYESLLEFLLLRPYVATDLREGLLRKESAVRLRRQEKEELQRRRYGGLGKTNAGVETRLYHVVRRIMNLQPHNTTCREMLICASCKRPAWLLVAEIDVQQIYGRHIRVSTYPF